MTPYAPSELPNAPWRTERLVLRPYRPSDAEMAHANLDTEEEIWKFDPGYPPTLEDRKANLARYNILDDQFGFGPCAAFLSGSESTFIGQGGLNPYIYDYRDGSRGIEFEVMFKLARPYWGQGYATELAHFWVNFAFEHVRLSRLVVGPERKNVRSVRLLERLGARIEDDWLDPDCVLAFIERPDR